MTFMKAWFATEYGKPADVLQLGELPMPEAKKDQVLVRITHSSLNPIDLRMTQGYGAALRRLAAPKEFPYVAGRDVVGEVVAVGPKAKKFKIGDRVVGITGIKDIGAHAQFSAISETNLAAAPEGVPSADLASIAYVGLTTWTALVGNLGFDPHDVAGKHFFVHAGSGGVGSFAVQWAHALGMWVTTTCGPSNVEWVKKLGADVVVNYAESDFCHEVKDVDYAYDTLGGEAEKGTIALVKRGGGYVSVVHQLMPYTDQHGLVLGGLRSAGRVIRKKSWNGFNGRKFAWSVCQPSEEGIEHIVAQVSEGKIKAVIEKELSMKDILEGYAHLETGRTKGKIILRWDEA
ncbi:MAG: zinc-binding dehydrogenase [Parvibaculaceae bacterium]|nr:zinc-binding dehydrogenase [Parvibaculaceae bacterium]